MLQALPTNHQQTQKNKICKPKDNEPLLLDPCPTCVYPEQKLLNFKNLYKEPIKVQVKKPGFTFDCISTYDLSPINEQENFYQLPLEKYMDLHLPDIGDFKCTSFNFTEKITNVNVRETLDFLLFEKAIYPQNNDDLISTTQKCEKF